MANYNPPLEDLPIFDNLVFIDPDAPITKSYADKHYLKYPTAQGTENLKAINVAGLATFNNDAVINENLLIDDSVNNTSSIIEQNNTILRIGSCSNSATPNSNISMYATDPSGNVVQQVEITNNKTQINNPTTMLKSLTMSGTGSNSSILNTYYELKDLTTGATDGTIYANNGTFIYDNNINSGSHEWAVNNSAGTQLIPLELNGAYSRFNTSSSNPLRVSDKNDGSKFTEQYQNGGGMTINNQVTNGSINISTKNSGGVLTQVLGLTNALVTVTATSLTLTTTNPPTSTATQPASNDSSTKIPTTAWVQSAISANIPASPFVPKFYNYSDNQSNVDLGYSTGPVINFNGTWAANDIAIFRVTGQISYNPDGNGQYQSTSNTSGVILFRPAYMYNAWAGYTQNICSYPSNTPNSVCAADRHILYYTPCYNIGNTSYFNVVGGVGYAQFGCISQGNGSTWTFLFSLEYLMSRTANGSVVISNGSGANAINNQLK